MNRALLLVAVILATACGRGERQVARTRAAATVDPAHPATLVQDLRVVLSPADSSPHGYVSSGTKVLFAADEGSTGFEPWITDGTEGGTALVADLRPGDASSLPVTGRIEGAPLAGGFVFAADDGSRGVELWFTNGTRAGTRLVRDVEPGSRSSNPRSFAAAGDVVYFVADTAASGTELWRTDGSEAGTVMVLDIASGAASSSPENLVAVGTDLWFTATDGSGTRLWRTSGGVTARVAGSPAYFPRRLTPFAGAVYYAGAETNALAAAARLYRTDPSGATSLVGSATDPALFTPLLAGAQGGRLYYAATSGGARDLYATSGTDESRLTTSNVAPSAVAAAGSHLFVSATVSADAGRELYTWDGTGLATLVDAAPGPVGSDPAGLTDVGGGVLLFSARDGATRSLFRSDGTPAGTSRVFVSGGPEVAGELVPFGGGALLTGADPVNGIELWRSDGTENGTFSMNLRPETTPGSYPQGLTAWNGALVFSADDGVNGREAWRTDPYTGATELLLELTAGPQSSAPDDFVVLGGTLLFTAAQPVYGRELWGTDGASVPVAPLRDIAPGATSSRPGRPVVLGDRAYFAADAGGAAGRELWWTDGVTAGLVKDLRAGGSSSPRGLVAAGGRVWFVADDGTGMPIAVRSDGTAAGTAAVNVLADGGGSCDPATASPDAFVTDPAWIARLGGTVVFSAVSPVTGRELFTADPVSGCVKGVTDLVPGVDDSNPVSFTLHAGAGWFGALDTDANPTPRYALLHTDGTPGGTARVAFVGQIAGGAVAAAASLDPTGVRTDVPLFFIGNDEVNGHELWVSDATHTAMVADTNPHAASGSEGSAILPLPWRGAVLYAADDGVHGRELWVSDGTRLGTHLVQDIAPGARSSNPADLTLVDQYVYFSADDGVHGRELWVLDASAAGLDLTPPFFTPCPAQVHVEASFPGGADPIFAVSASDTQSPPVTISYVAASGATLPIGLTSVDATARDAAGNAAACTFVAEVSDTTPPALSCPGDRQVEATGPDGAVVTYAAVATDAATPPGSLGVVYAPTSGTRFPLGPHRAPATVAVDVTATDGVGLQTACTFHVTVADTTPPAVTCPSVPAVEATGPAGAAATWAAATATDAVSAAASITVAYDVVQGAVLPLGTTTVTATATDEAGNARSCTFPVRVVDTIPPVVTCPAIPAVEATSSAGAAVSFAATATDLATPSPLLTYDVAPGSTFPLGTTSVTATARDGSGNAATCSFPVVVQDTLAPVLVCPGPDLVVEAQDAAGAVVVFDATASDTVTASPAITYAPASGGLIALDLPTPVRATAQDAAGNVSTCDFAVTVRDRLAPAVTCPTEVFYEATSATSTLVVHPRAFAHDLVTPDPDLAYSFSRPDRQERPLGSLSVDATVADARGNTSAPCRFVSTVRDTTAPVPTCPASVGVEATGPAGAVGSWLDATGDDSVTPASSITVGFGLVSYDAVQGGVFPVGTTHVTATVRDQQSNAATCGFDVVVRDTTPPAVTCPGPVTAEATGPGGAAVSFDAAAADAVGPALPAVSFTPARGSTFPLGATTVTASATDAAGNTGTCTFPVTVVDTTPPTLGCPGVVAEATGPAGAPVSFAVTATDLVTAAPSVVMSAASGDVFPLGTTDVAVSATDARGNGATCTVRVEVRDTTPPAITCPPDVTVEASGVTTVAFGQATATDAVTATPAISATARSGDAFPVGVTAVTFTARDAAGNVAHCSMSVTVRTPAAPPPPPAPAASSGGCGCGAGSAGSSALLGLVALVLARRRRR